MTRWLNLALRKSKDSTHRKHKMAAVVVQGGRVISLATNTGDWGQHAELRALKDKDVVGATIIVARQNGRCSKPCKKCFELIRESGISKMVYINKDGSMTEERV